MAGEDVVTGSPEWTLLARDPAWGGGVVVLMERLQRELSRRGAVSRVVLGRVPGGWSLRRLAPFAMLRDVVALRTSKPVRSGRWLVFNSAMEWRPVLRELLYLGVTRSGEGQLRVLFVHGWNAETWNRVAAPTWVGRLVRRRMARLDRILVLSEAFRNALREGGLDGDRIRVVRTCFAPEDIPDSPHPARGDAPLELIYLGLLAPAKGVRELLAAASRMAGDGVDFRLTVAGEGPLRSELHEYAASQGLGGNVRFPGYLGVADKREALGRAAVLVLPSHREGLPLSVLEGMASGCAVVTTATGGLRDHFEGEEDGIVFVEPHDPEALARTLSGLVADPDRVARLGAHGKARAWADFTPEAAAADFVAALGHGGG